MISQLPLFTKITNFMTVIELIFALIIMSVVLPKVWRQSKVKNGLKELRHSLLIEGGAGYLILALSFILLVIGFIIPREYRVYTIGTLLVFFGLMADVYALSKLKIYSLNYSDESIRSHARIDKLEKAEVKREKKRGGVL